MKSLQCKRLDYFTMLLTVSARERDGFSIVDHMEADSFPRNLVKAKLQKLARRGLVDWGVCIDYCWLTLKGEVHIEEIAEQRRRAILNG